MGCRCGCEKFIPPQLYLLHSKILNGTQGLILAIFDSSGYQISTPTVGFCAVLKAVQLAMHTFALLAKIK